jgi:hypothetical protein
LYILGALRCDSTLSIQQLGACVPVDVRGLALTSFTTLMQSVMARTSKPGDSSVPSTVKVLPAFVMPAVNKINMQIGMGRSACERNSDEKRDAKHNAIKTVISNQC